VRIALIGLAAVILLALAPLAFGGYELTVLTVMLVFVLLSVGLDLVSGYCGQTSFAQGAFYGLGAYTAAIMARDLGTGILVNLPAGAVVAGLFGVLLGIPALRLSGHFLGIVTIAFQTIVYLVLSQWTSFTGGQVGLSLPPVGALRIFGLQVARIDDIRAFYWLTLVVCMIGLVIAWRLTRSRLGQEWIAIRDDEKLAGAIGLNPTWGKLTAFVASAALAGAGGVLIAHALRGVTPDDFTIWTSATVVAMMVLGGRGTFVGPIIGAVLLTALPEVLGRFAEYKLIIYGVIMIVMITLLPEGVFGWASRRASRG
jgi:branched-chain amino acid transport system permease protein